MMERTTTCETASQREAESRWVTFFEALYFIAIVLSIYDMQAVR